MIKTIFDYLSSDSELVELLGYTQLNKRINPFVPTDKTDYPFLVYEVSPFLADNATTQYRVDLRTVTQDPFQMESISKRLMSLFHFRNRPGFILNNEPIYHSKHSGGTTLYDNDTKVYEHILTFNIKSN